MANNTEALAEYRRKLAAGEVEKAVTRTPAEIALDQPKSLRAAINANCWNCVGESKQEVRLCVMRHCPFYNLRPWK